MSLRETLMELERGFWVGDAEFYDAHLAEECRMVFPEMEPMGRKEAITGIAKGARWASVTMSDLWFLPLTDGSAMLSYSATAVREGDDEPYQAQVGSVYVGQGEDWRLAFHQQTSGA